MTQRVDIVQGQIGWVIQKRIATFIGESHVAVGQNAGEPAGTALDA